MYSTFFESILRPVKKVGENIVHCIEKVEMNSTSGLLLKYSGLA